ncbi:recombinase family protein [Sinorhizobium meliloti]|uniref:recombinase family protein n=1 Tax=Rhizobium meliloti TaxID=382 RepID=UPI000FD9892C|nr:recombinase family protein [Sinorhizobium meliloti]RVI34236.1 recombinase family protein [Sinorhizobium meliloti]
MGTSIGYARVSTEEQNLDLQLTALREAGCERIFRDKASGAGTKRKGLTDAIALCIPGDVLVVWKLDRLGRSLLDLIGLIESLNACGVGLRVLAGHGAMIDTTRPEGRMIFGMLAVLAEFERELIRERTKAGMHAAKQRGAAIGRPRKLSQTQIRRAKSLIESGRQTRERIAARLGVHVGTLRRAIAGAN